MDTKQKLKTTDISFKKKFIHLFAPYYKFKKWKNKNEYNKKLFKDIKNIILILFCSFLILVLWVNRINFYPENIMLWVQSKFSSTYVGEKFPCKFEGEKVASENFKFNNKNLTVLSDTAFNVINEFGNITRSEKHNFSNPCLKSGNIRNIIYDRGGKNFRIESFVKTLYSGTTKKAIISGAIADNGVFAIAEQSTSHLAEMGVFNKSGKEKYRYSFSDYYISDIALNAFGTEGAACGIASNNGNINSAVYILDFNSEKPKSQFILNDNVVTRIKYLTGGNILAIGDKYISFINLKTKSVNNFSYGNKLLKFYDFDKNNGICCCLSSSVNETGEDEIIMLNTVGKKMFNIKTSESFINLSYRNNKVLGLTPNKIMIYNSSEKCEGYINLSSHAKKAILTSHSNAYTLETDQINKIKISHLEKIKK